MKLIEIILLAVGLAMDASAAAVCKGLSMQRYRLRASVIVGLWFGGFQALMPAIGFLLGTAFEHFINTIDHWIAFALLTLIGVNMLREAVKGRGKTEPAEDSLSVRAMLPMAVATSIDALAAGVTFPFLDVSLPTALICIGSITFLLSAVGVRIGTVFGARFKTGAEIAGGVILILLGVKTLLEHLGVLAL